MRTSSAGRKLIKRHEGLSLKAYKDPVGVWTIGWGHTGPDAREGNEITNSRAESLLSADIREAEDDIRRLVKVDLSQGQFDALVSFTFNVGGGALAKSTLLRELNAGKYAAIPGQLRRWVYGTVGGQKVILPGLVKRRSDEAVLWASASAVEDEEPGAGGVVAEPPPAKVGTAMQATGGLTASGVLAIVGARAGESDQALYVFLALAALVGLYAWIKARRTA